MAMSSYYANILPPPPLGNAVNSFGSGSCVGSGGCGGGGGGGGGGGDNGDSDIST